MSGKTASKTGTKRSRPSPKSGQTLPLGAHPGNTGGKKGRSGRIPLKVTLLCQQIDDRLALAEIVGKIAAAELGEKYIANDGEVIYGETKNTDRLAAVKLLWGYAYGAAPQTMVLTGDDDAPLVISSPRDTLARRLARLAATS